MKKFEAFSLIELLISLIIISVITASFAPVLTHRLKNHGVSISQKGLSFDKCTEIDENCEICIGNICYGCSKDCNNNQYKDVAKCKCIDCKAKYGISCLACNADSCKSCQSGYAPTAEGCLSCSETYGSACTSCNSNQCTYCKAGYGYNPTTKQCNPCGENEYSTGGLGSCLTCGAGTQVNANKNGCDAIAITCSDDQYLDGDTCRSCLSYHTKCTKCDNKKCIECKEGYISDYELHYETDYGCLKKVTKDVCKTKFDGAYYELVTYFETTPYCITKRNMGYSANGSSAAKYKEVPIPTSAGVSKAKIGSKCSQNATEDAKCCWYGTTGDNAANTANSGSDDLQHKNNKIVTHTYTYSGLKRTICNVAAARAICSAYNQGDVNLWRVLGQAPLDHSFSYPALGTDDNLQLCAESGYLSSNGMQCYPRYEKCIYNDGTKADCHPGIPDTTGGGGGAYDYKRANSVRCYINAYPSL